MRLVLGRRAKEEELYQPAVLDRGAETVAGAVPKQGAKEHEPVEAHRYGQRPLPARFVRSSPGRGSDREPPAASRHCSARGRRGRRARGPRSSRDGDRNECRRGSARPESDTGCRTSRRRHRHARHSGRYRPRASTAMRRARDPSRRSDFRLRPRTASCPCRPEAACRRNCGRHSWFRPEEADTAGGEQPAEFPGDRRRRRRRRSWT